MSTKKSRAVTGPGYLHPSFSPDGKYITATKTSACGTDVVVLSLATGAEVLQLTNDGTSWAPVWSAAGDQIAYLHSSGQLVDLEVAQLEGSAPAWTVKESVPLTQNAGLDGASHPAWYVPADQIPAQPTPAPTVGASPSTAP
jgi:Tol biopolymer transport system component